jgi:hypothetical protein
MWKETCVCRAVAIANFPATFHSSAIHKRDIEQYCYASRNRDSPARRAATKNREEVKNMSQTATKLERKSLNAPDEVRKFDKGKLEIVNVDGVTIGRATFEPGWKWSTCLKSVANTKSCMAAHFGYQLSGTLVTRMDDGSQTVSKAGDVLMIPPGHDAWVEGDEPTVVIDFQGFADYAKKK